MISDLELKINEIYDELIKFRRDLHMYPDLSYEEENTMKKIAKALEGLGLEIETNVGGYSVVALLRGASEGKTVLLRADIDALPIFEKSGLEYSSKIDGVMHACGHDVHTTILLGVAKILSQHKDKIKGNIKFCFQPAEEVSPTGGAQYMIDAGVLENPKVDAAMALHVWNNKLGTVAVRDGAMMAQSDRISITVKGRSAHASQPHKGADAIVAAGHIITAMQSAISRNTDPFDNAVVTIGTISGGKKYNIICDSVQLEGTIRILSEKVSEKMPKLLENIAVNVGKGLGCEVDFNYTRGYAMTKNDHELFQTVVPALKEELGEENVLFPEYPNTGGEDFSAFGKYVPSIYMWLGMESEINEGRVTIHSNNLLIDERMIPVGIKTFIASAFAFLEK
ncbi:MAG: amidohydrolase [Tissierellia bacterium]|nr:amidohydrolase [Tissierellia bacterium]